MQILHHTNDFQEQIKPQSFEQEQDDFEYGPIFKEYYGMQDTKPQPSKEDIYLEEKMNKWKKAFAIGATALAVGISAVALNTFDAAQLVDSWHQEEQLSRRPVTSSQTTSINEKFLPNDVITGVTRDGVRLAVTVECGKHHIGSADYKLTLTQDAIEQIKQCGKDESFVNELGYMFVVDSQQKLGFIGVDTQADFDMVDALTSIRDNQSIEGLDVIVKNEVIPENDVIKGIRQDEYAAYITVERGQNNITDDNYELTLTQDVIEQLQQCDKGVKFTNDFEYIFVTYEGEYGVMWPCGSNFYEILDTLDAIKDNQPVASLSYEIDGQELAINMQDLEEYI